MIRIFKQANAILSGSTFEIDELAKTGPFSFSDPSVFSGLCERHGFEITCIKVVDCRTKFANIKEMLRGFSGSQKPGAELCLNKLVEEYLEAAGECKNDDGSFELNNTCVIAVAKKI